MDEGVNVLFEMARIDAQLFELRKNLKKIPGRVANARRQLDSEQTLLDDLQNPWNELQHEIEEKESTIKLALETIEKFEAHMKMVTTQKEYMAARKQVDDARKLNNKLQDEILEKRVLQEEIDPKLAEAGKRHSAVKETFHEMEGTIKKEKAVMEREFEEDEAKIKGLVGSVGDHVWNYYQKLIKTGRMPAIVPAVSGTCTGCHMFIRPQEYNKLIADPGGFHTCPSCTRIIYYKAGEQIVEEPAAAEAAQSS